jgi:hypothetical protein
VAQNNLPPRIVSAKPVAVPQARLILQDPLAFDQATQPALRSSIDMLAEPATPMEREKARELWENLSLEPEVAQERQAERKRLLSRADQLAKETAAAKAKTLALEAELARARDERLNHPLVYAGAAGLVGLGALWWLERRKRMVLQDRELDLLAEQSPPLRRDEPNSYLQEPGAAYSLEDSPDLAHDFATDLPGLPEPEPLPTLALHPEPAPREEAPGAASSTSSVPTLKTKVQAAEPLAAPLGATPGWALPAKSSLAAEDMQPLREETQDRSLLAMSKRVLDNMLRRRSQRDALNSSQLPTEMPSSVHESTAAPSTIFHSEQHDDATQMLYDEEAQLAFEQELLAQRLHVQQEVTYDPDQANIDLLSQTRVTPQRGESAMEHLLELRTAVNGLCALGRPEGAAKLLEEHIAADPGTCAWAYLEYMNVCEHLNWRDEFESMRKRYRLHFNRMAPYWHEPNSNVLGLDGYARAAGELCTVWAQGRSQAHSTLAAWLAGPLLGRKLVQLPAYHDLFDLYEMLEFVAEQASAVQTASAHDSPLSAQAAIAQAMALAASGHSSEPEQEFVPTVSLLDLDYEFSSDVTLEEREVAQSEKAVTIVKTGNFSVDFNVAGTQMGSLPSLPATLDKK